VGPNTEAVRPTVLVAGASPSWTERVRSALADVAVELVCVSSGAVALARLAGEGAGARLVVVEARLDDMSGLAFCRRLREAEAGGGALLLLVSPFADEMDRILAFECGADDVTPDPFFPRELASRVQALLRRGARPREADGGGDAPIGPLRLDLQKATVEIEGEPVPLTWREFEVLRLLAQERGRVVARAALVGLLLGAPDAASPRLIDTYVKSIRRKLGGAGGLIETVRGVGYRLSDR
jgi:two-component system phosphate regulon response regulator PhoB